MPSPEADTPEITLEQFARIVAALEAGEPRDEVLARDGLSLEAWSAASEGWLARLAGRATAGDLGLCRQYVELCAGRGAAAKRRPRAARKARPGTVPVAPSARLVRLVELEPAGTRISSPQAAAAGAPRLAASPPVPRGAEAPQTPAVVPPPPARAGASLTTGDFVSPSAGVRPATPFRAPPPASPMAPAAPGSLGTPHTPAPPAAARAPVKPAPGSGTLPDLSAARAAAPLPFKREPAAAAPSPKLDETAVFDGSKLLKAATPFMKPAPPAPASPPTAPPRPVTSVTLADYAKLCATVRMFPDQVPDIMRRYGFDASSWRELHALWQERFAKDVSLKDRWQTLVERNLPRRTP